MGGELGGKDGGDGRDLKLSDAAAAASANGGKLQLEQLAASTEADPLLIRKNVRRRFIHDKY